MAHKSYCFDGGTPTGPSHGSGDTPNRGNGDCGGSTKGFDCSGLALYAVYQGTGGAVRLPHSSSAQSSFGGQVVSSQAALQPGDLVFFAYRTSGVVHVGVYAGNATVWDADDYGVPVQTHTLSWLEHGSGALRFVRGVRYWDATSSTPVSAGATPPPVTTPPSVTAPTDTPPAGDGTAPPPAAATGAAPPATYAETSGSVVDTWADPSDAGGSAGPEIPSNASVQIACQVPGLAVADGNTAWYLIASSPWNGAYYASADAFYNNGASSGPLSGTPFVDPGVPSCSGARTGSSGSKPAPPPQTYAETPGSVVHTWSDAADAGGNAGPEISSNTMVQIVCKLTGFAVADGDTWWYRVASRPWNGSYYGSADAFYNDGATSGSLIGTPFVDTNIPDC